MSAKLINYVEWPAENGIIGQCCCDTAAELPAVNAFSSLGTLVATSTCRVINESATYQLNTQGVWKKKTDATSVVLDLTGYYSSAETDAQIATQISSAIAGLYPLDSFTTIPDNTDILTLPFGRYVKVTGLSTLTNRPTGYTGAILMIVEKISTSGRRRDTIYPISETSNTISHFCILENATTPNTWGSWVRFDGGTVL